MRDWWRRLSQRHLDVSSGADSDLFRENRIRWQRGMLAVGVAVVFSWLGAKLHLSGIAARILVVVLSSLWIYGFLLLLYAKEQSSFLSKPDPEKPFSPFTKR